MTFLSIVFILVIVFVFGYLCVGLWQEEAKREEEKENISHSDVKYFSDGKLRRDDLVEYSTVLGIPVKIKRFNKMLPLPKYQTEGSAGFDLYSRIDKTIYPKEVVILPSNIAIETPKGYVSLVLPRSSLPLKTPLRVANSAGVIDSDYCGDSDEIGIIVQNVSSQPYEVKKGERIAQLLIVPVVQAHLIETDHLENKDRGGFGSTGS